MDNKNKAALAVACALGASFAANISNAEPVLSTNGKYYFDDAIRITTKADPLDPENEREIRLPANIRIPASNDPSETFPLVVFINSWALDEYEYSDQSKLLANKGYAVLSYTTRGFGRAPGLVNTAGEKDVYDAQQAISYALDNYPIQEEAIALGGVSYGAGISLLAGLQDERVDAILSFSGWGSLIESLWGGNTPAETWINLLIGSGDITGRLDPVVRQNYNNMKQHQNVEDTKQWGSIRSPLTYLDDANARDNPPALYASNNLHDFLFQPNSMVELLSNYEGPWRSEFNFGTHGQGEAGGLTGNDSLPWKRAHEWLDHYLKGIDNGIDTLPPVNTVVRSRSLDLPSVRESFDRYPIAKASDHINYYLSPIPDPDGFGGLESSEDLGYDSITFDTDNSIVSAGAVSGALTGAGHAYPIKRLDPDHSAIFVGGSLNATLHIRGEINLELWATIEEKSQYFAYLLDYKPGNDKAVVISHAPFSWHSSEQGVIPVGPAKINIEFYWMAYDVDAGNQLILVIEGKDPDYWRYSDTPRYNTLEFGPATISKLDIPTIKAPALYYTVDDPKGTESDPNFSREAGGDGDGDDYGPGSGSFSWVGLVGLLCFMGLSRVSRSRRLDSC
ncbi:MAG: hypothetical protein MI976_10300 [Pseudomonadales bacterium]|nr:hypothetical protein [Pseudomonadales bacterium]